MVSGQIYNAHIPLIVMGTSAVLIFIAARSLRISNKVMAIMTALTFLIAGAFVLFDAQLWKGSSSPAFFKHQLLFTAFYEFEAAAELLIVLALAIGFCVSVYSAGYMNDESRQHTYYPLLLLMITGLVGMLYSADLLVMYLFCELMSICTYALVAFRRKNETVIEAGFKYLIMGSVASVVLLAGISIFFLAYGTIDTKVISIRNGWMPQLGGLLTLAGFSLKSALVPLHTWLPDAHGKAPSSISAVLSGVLVQSVLYVMLRINITIGIESKLLGSILLVMALLNILVGNLMGLVQVNLKRMLGYSTVAQIGYITLCFAVGLRNGSNLALQCGFFITITHACAKSLAFLTAGTFYHHEEEHEIRELRRLKSEQLFPIVAMCVAILSLSALPPFPGFTGKWTALTSIFASKERFTIVITLALLAGSLIAFGYYLPLLYSLLGSFQHKRKYPPVRRGLQKISIWIALPIAFLTASILFFIIAPQLLLEGTYAAAQFMVDSMR